jgi:hypothetical protein
VDFPRTVALVTLGILAYFVLGTCVCYVALIVQARREDRWFEKRFGSPSVTDTGASDARASTRRGGPTSPMGGVGPILSVGPGQRRPQQGSDGHPDASPTDTEREP